VKRREFITLLGGAAAWPLAARAQQRTRLPTIGVLGVSTSFNWSQWTAAFVERLGELGWSDAAMLRLSIAGQTDVANALLRSQPSSCG
jgi:putative ABC transport system substrate-binding protein